MNPLNILLLEDNPVDAELLQYNLRKDGLAFNAVCVDSEPAFKRALNDFKPDIVLSDYSLPSYNGREALEYIQKDYPDIPVIIVSGAIGEEKAVELLNAGARDYILKDRLSRLSSGIRRVLQEQEEVKTRIEYEKKLIVSETRYRLLVENSPLCIHEIDLQGKIISMNKAGLDMMGFKTESEVIGYKYLEAVSASDRNRIDELMHAAYSGQPSQFEFKSSSVKNQFFKSCFVPIKTKQGEVEKLMGISEDITQRKINEAALQESESHFRLLADYDALTGLPNRRLLNDRLGQAMVASKRSGRYGALMFLDLDNFKPLNDTYGHDIGDLLLIEVANRIRKCIREVDTVCRFGGDEFVVMIVELDEDEEPSIMQSGIIAEKIRVILAEPYFLTIKQEGKPEIAIKHNCTASIGLKLFVNHHDTPEDILKWADMAMYQAKAAGRNCTCFFKSEAGIERNLKPGVVSD